MLLKRILNRLFKRREIVNCDRDLYLTRWFLIRTPVFALFLHQFIRSDEDRALHDHPWAFIVIPLWRGYYEHSEQACDCFWCRNHPTMPPRMFPTFRRVWPIIGTRFRRATYRHRVELIDGRPSWSLFIRFRKQRVWGFWTATGFVAWDKWWQDKCE